MKLILPNINQIWDSQPHHGGRFKILSLNKNDTFSIKWLPSYYDAFMNLSSFYFNVLWNKDMKRLC